MLLFPVHLAFENRRESESEVPLELNESWGRIATKERTQDAGRGIHGADDRAKVGIGDIANRLVEVGMVE